MTHIPFFQCATNGFTNMGKSSDGDVAKLPKKSNLCVFRQRNMEMFPGQMRGGLILLESSIEASPGLNERSKEETDFP